MTVEKMTNSYASQKLSGTVPTTFSHTNKNVPASKAPKCVSMVWKKISEMIGEHSFKKFCIAIVLDGTVQNKFR